MARKALLTTSDCIRIRTLHQGGTRAIDLAKKYGVSESSLYKVLDGSYKARSDEPHRQALPVVKPDKPVGVTPSLFENAIRSMDPEHQQVLSKMLEKAQQIDDFELDDLTIAAAELVVAKARFYRVLAHIH